LRPETAFGREFKKAQAISYLGAGRDMSLSHDLYWSFIRYQTMIKREFEVMAKKTASSSLTASQRSRVKTSNCASASASNWEFARRSTLLPPR